MPAAAEPQRHAVGLDLGRDLPERNEGAVDDGVPCHRGGLAGNGSAQRGFDPIRRDDGPAFFEVAAGEAQPCAGAGIDGAHRLARRVEFDRRPLACRGQQAGQQVRPVADAVGGAETLLEGLAEAYALQEGARHAVPYVNFRGDDAGRLNCLPCAQFAECAHPIGRHLQPRAHFLEGLGLLEQAHRCSPGGKAQCRRQPGDAATGHEERMIAHGGSFSRFSAAVRCGGLRLALASAYP